MNLLYLSSLGGGLDTNVRVLAPALASAGHKISVLYLGPAGSTPMGAGNRAGSYSRIFAYYGNWHYYAFRATFRATSLPRVIRSFEQAMALRRVVRTLALQEPLDLIEIPEVFTTRSLLDGVPYVVRLHSSAWMCKQMFGEHVDLADNLERRLESFSLKRAIGISTPSMIVGSFIRKTCNLESRAIELIPYPVDATVFAPGDSPRDSLRVLFVGRVEKRKGADTLMQAIPFVAKCLKVEFFFAGRLCEDVRALANSMPSNVHFLGVIPHEELAKWYQSAAICVAPSRWDNSPNTIYEAMACGTPVIASGAGGIPELIDDGETGILVPPSAPKILGDAIVSLLKDWELREQIGRRAREKAVAEYSVAKACERTMAFYKRILAQPSLAELSNKASSSQAY